MGDDVIDELCEVQAEAPVEPVAPEPPKEEQQKPPMKRRGGVVKQMWR